MRQVPWSVSSLELKSEETIEVQVEVVTRTLTIQIPLTSEEVITDVLNQVTTWLTLMYQVMVIASSDPLDSKRQSKIW
jgi:hypothetical protein